MKLRRGGISGGTAASGSAYWCFGRFCGGINDVGGGDWGNGGGNGSGALAVCDLDARTYVLSVGCPSPGRGGALTPS